MESWGSLGLLEEDDVETLWAEGLPAAATASASGGGAATPAPVIGTSLRGASTQDDSSFCILCFS